MHIGLAAAPDGSLLHAEPARLAGSPWWTRPPWRWPS